jgi:hypothetical protein
MKKYTKELIDKTRLHYISEKGTHCVVVHLYLYDEENPTLTVEVDERRGWKDTLVKKRFKLNEKDLIKNVLQFANCPDLNEAIEETISFLLTNYLPTIH